MFKQRFATASVLAFLFISTLLFFSTPVFIGFIMLIVLIAGLILSSFPPERINSKPHHNINTIESIHANKTKRDIDNSIKSQNVIVSANNGLLVAVVAAVFNAYVVLIIINLLLI